MKNHGSAVRPARRVHLAAALLLALLVCILPAAGSAKYNARLRKGTRISVLGDSISTYAGWSDARPITGPECTYRYGEAYYGPKGGDYHSTDFLVTDTWWHQAATQLGGEILVSNAGNSTGLFCASYPPNAEWDQYLKDMLAWKTRPYYLGVGKINPDIIALYIGSNEVARATPDQYGSVEDVNFSQLIQKSGKSFIYAEPQTVAEAYCIMLHKIQQTYPKAEIYCFAVLPNSGGRTSDVNKRLQNVLPFNEMVRGVAAHYGACVVDILDEFALDPDGDGVANDAAVKEFQTCFYEGPHPNAKGFDVITNRFVSVLLENSRHIVGNRKNPPAVTVTTGTTTVDVETTAGKSESVEISYTTESETALARTRSAGDTLIRSTSAAVDYLTARGMTVNYAGSSVTKTDASGMTIGSSSSSYTSVNDNGYWAEGGHDSTVKAYTPGQEVTLSLIAGEPVTVSSQHSTATQVSGDVKTSPSDGVYDYTETNLVQQGSVTITTEGVVLEKKETTGTDLTYVINQTSNTSDNDMVTNPPSTVDSPDSAVIPYGFDFQYIGSNKYSRFWSAHAYTSPETLSPAYEYNGVTGKTFYFGYRYETFLSRGFLVPKYYLYDEVDIEQEKLPAQFDHIQHFTLTDRNRNILSAYCADKETPAVKGYNYIMENLEDATYYSEEEARKIRVIANNGYWGAKSGFGSLKAVQDMMVASGKLTADEAAKITDGMAMTATQYAIWSCSNVMTGVEFVHAYYADENNDCDGSAATKEDADLIFKLFFHLLDLAKDAPSLEENTSNTVITEKNFLSDVRVALTDKPESLEENLDADPVNDVYLADLSFSLGVDPLQGNRDNLVVVIEDGMGNVISTGRIAGTPNPGETRLTPDDNGMYSFHGVELTEEGPQSIVLRMHGTQNLAKDVYLFSSEEKNGETSQTLVGVAEGSYGVNVQMRMSFLLDVTDDIFSFDRFWRNEKWIPTPPKTGDSSMMLLYLSLLLASCAALCLGLRKRAR